MTDATYREGRASIRTRDRNGRVWDQMMGLFSRCRFCGHGAEVHKAWSGQPFFWRPAEFAERGKRILRYAARDWALKRQMVDRRVDMIELFCERCAGDMRTDQVLCFQRRHGRGEVVGVPVLRHLTIRRIP